MKKLLLQLIVLVIFTAASCACCLAVSSIESDEEWVYMPAFAKPSYMGIHGGTMPISLLVSGDGDALVTFVGRTGNDFLEALRNGHLPSIGNSTVYGMNARARTGNLVAGNSSVSMPVLPLSKDILSLLQTGHELEPFGLTDEKISIEGTVAKPQNFPHSRSLRLFSLPDYFQPRKNLHIKAK